MNSLFFSILLSALIMKESGGKTNVIGDNGKAIGILQIHACVIEDVNTFYHTHYTWPESAQDPETAKIICVDYLKHYCTAARLGHEPTFEDESRVWNGGPNGYKKQSTIPYWDDVKKNIDKITKTK